MNDLDRLLKAVHLRGQASLVRQVPCTANCRNGKFYPATRLVEYVICEKCNGKGTVLNFHYDPLPAKILRDCLLEQKQVPALRTYYRALVLAEPGNDEWRLLYADFIEKYNGEKEYAKAIRLQIEVAKLRPCKILLGTTHLSSRGPRCWEMIGEDHEGADELIDGDRVTINLDSPDKKPKFALRYKYIPESDSDALYEDTLSVPDGFEDVRLQERKIGWKKVWIPKCLWELDAATWKWSRGFISEVGCSFADLENHAEKLIYWGPRECSCVEENLPSRTHADCNGTGELPGLIIDGDMDIGDIMIPTCQASVLLSHHPIETISFRRGRFGEMEIFNDRWPTIKTWKFL